MGVSMGTRMGAGSDRDAGSGKSVGRGAGSGKSIGSGLRSRLRRGLREGLGQGLEQALGDGSDGRADAGAMARRRTAHRQGLRLHGWISGPGRRTPGARLVLAGDDGATTAEFAIVTMAAVGFAGLLVVILRSDGVRATLEGLVARALGSAG